MELKLKRRYKGSAYTIGTLYVNGVAFCDTLEDRDRGLDASMSASDIAGVKVYGNTAIPCGMYRIDMDTISPKFKSRSWARKYGGIVPRLVGVKGFSGVLIHVGNTAAETLGCVLVGENKVKGQVVNSANVYFRLIDRYLMPAKQRGETITITIL